MTRWARRRGSPPGEGRRRAPDLSTAVGTVALPNPVMTASGTSGHGAELAPYLDLASLGAVVVKSLASFPWGGNPAPRVHPVGTGMINSVGLQGPGMEHWLQEDLPVLLTTGARVVASIWGRTPDDYAEAAALLRDAPPGVVAVEVNLSCPNLTGHGMFSQSAEATREVMALTAACGRPRWAKLTAAVMSVAQVAAAAVEGGAAAVTLVNTLPGMVIDVATRSPVLGAGGGGLSGPAIHPVAVRAVFDVHAELPNLSIVGVGGVVDAASAVELVLAGASAVQVGTATFADPHAPGRVLRDLSRWCRDHGVDRLADLVGAAHAEGSP